MAEPGPTPEEELAHLATLGYVDFAEEDDALVGGVVVHDGELSCPGYNLLTSLPHGLSVLMDARGTEVKSWESEGRVTTRCILLPDGDVLIVSTDGFLTRLGWNGEERWSVGINAHHDVRWLPSGEIAVLTYVHRIVPSVHETTPVRDDHVTLVSPDGEVLETYSLWDMIEEDGRVAQDFRDRFFGSKVPFDEYIDIVHANSVEWIQRPDLADESPLYAPSNVIVSMRMPDRIAIFDTEARRVLWNWGDGEVNGPHEARLLPNGDILVFDNGYRQGRSRIVEVDPRTGRIVWQYVAEVPREFLTRTRGTAQLLANDNVLVSNSNAGKAFEVDRAGRIVWGAVNPHEDEKGRRGTIRVARYEPEYVERILEAMRER